MDVRGVILLENFSQIHPRAKRPLKRWLDIMRSSEFRSFAELRRTFGSVDCVGDLTVFNISGNHFRLVVLVNYIASEASVWGVYTHDEYTKLIVRKK